MKAITVKTAFKILTVILMMGLCVACNQHDKYREEVSVSEVDISEDYEAIAKNQVDDVNPEITTSAMPQNLKIIKSASSRYKVKNVKQATNAIKQMASKYDAYISDLRFENDNYRREMRFTVKIPAVYFDALMDSVSSVSEFIEYENITTKDVTEEYLDLQTRLNTKIEVKARYENILRKNAKTVEDILATEDKLRIIQEEIESAQGRLNYLTNKVSYSTIQIDLYETVAFKNEPTSYTKTFWSKIKEALVFGWDLIESIFIGLLYVWPLVILGLLTVFFVRNRMKRRHK